MKNYIIFLLAALGLLACKTEEKQQEVAEWPHAVTYEIFVQSFNDSNGDGIGDINGMTEKLDYLAELGVKGVWLMPIMPSPSYHKYDVTDYRDIHPDYGTLDDFKNFVNKAHEKGIHVVIDLVINHSSSLHPWFMESKKGAVPVYTPGLWNLKKALTILTATIMYGKQKKKLKAWIR